MALLFAYGTLQRADVQRALFGRSLQGQPDALAGFALSSVTIADPDGAGSAVFPILVRGDACVAGLALAVTEAELAIADDYEGDSYVRVAVRLQSGNEAFVYVHPDGA